METFDAATSFVGSELGKVTEPNEDQQLKFYGFYKQAICGDCNTSKPWAWNFIGVAKWKAWKACEGMSSESAKSDYVNLLASMVPSWEGMETSGKPDHSGPSMMSGGVFSRPVEEESIIMEEDKTIFDYTMEGNSEKVRKLLQTSGCDTDARDDTGQSILHIACDRGHHKLVSTLINEFHMTINAQNMAKETPLHIAVLCEEEIIIKLLLDAKADVSIQNEDGETAEEIAEGEIKKHF